MCTVFFFKLFQILNRTETSLLLSTAAFHSLQDKVIRKQGHIVNIFTPALIVVIRNSANMGFPQLIQGYKQSFTVITNKM